MKISDATGAHVMFVGLHMRDRDLAELSAVYPQNTRQALAPQLARRYGGRRDTICAQLDGEAIAIGATAELRPNVLTLAFFATDRFPEIAVRLTKFLKQRLFPPMVAAGVHRIECVSIAGYDDAHRWLETLGLEAEAPVLRKFGKRGEDFIPFAWVGDVRATSL